MRPRPASNCRYSQKGLDVNCAIDGIDGGWVKLWRKTLDSEVFADPQLMHLFVWCLLSASHTAHHVPVKTGRGNTVITVGPGQFLYGRKSLARTLRLKDSTARRRMKRLESMGMIAIQPDTHFSIVTVCNWSIYQGNSGKSGHPTGHPKDTRRTGKGQARNTYKKGEKGENVKNGEKTTVEDDDDGFPSWKNARARELEQAGTFKVRGEQHKATESDRVDVLRACKLTEDGAIAQAWLEEAAQRTRDNKPAENAYGYFLKTLRGICADNGVDFGKIAAALEVPKALRRSFAAGS